MNGYELVSEILANHPNTDMLIMRPYFFVYIKRDKIDSVKRNGISVNGDGVIQALFSRLPERKYFEYLHDHVPVRIAVSKLFRIKNQDVKISPINFEYQEKDNLSEDDIQDIFKKHSDKFTSMIDGRSLSNIPRVDIHLSDGNLPSFAIKVLEIEPVTD